MDDTAAAIQGVWTPSMQEELDGAVYEIRTQARGCRAVYGKHSASYVRAMLASISLCNVRLVRAGHPITFISTHA